MGSLAGLALNRLPRTALTACGTRSPPCMTPPSPSCRSSRCRWSRPRWATGRRCAWRLPARSQRGQPL